MKRQKQSLGSKVFLAIIVLISVSVLSVSSTKAQCNLESVFDYIENIENYRFSPSVGGTTHFGEYGPIRLYGKSGDARAILYWTEKDQIYKFYNGGWQNDDIQRLSYYCKIINSDYPNTLEDGDYRRLCLDPSAAHTYYIKVPDHVELKVRGKSLNHDLLIQCEKYNWVFDNIWEVRPRIDFSLDDNEEKTRRRTIASGEGGWWEIRVQNKMRDHHTCAEIQVWWR